VKYLRLFEEFRGFESGKLRLIIENEEYINSIKELINTFDPNNIDMAFQIMKGMKIKQSVILDEYKELFEIFKLKPSKLNLIKMGSRKEVYVGIRSSVPDILFKMPNLKGLGIFVNNLGNLTSFDGDLRLYSTGSQINSLPKLESVGGSLHLHTTSIKDLGDLKYVGGDLNLRRTPIESLGNLKSVGGNLDLSYSQIETLGNLESVGGYLDLYNTPIESLGNLKSVGGSLNLRKTQIESLDDLKYVGRDLYLKNTPLSKTTTEKELRKQINVKGKIYLLGF
jgi:hypothetical protein